MNRLFVSAGEPSGDRHAAAVVTALRSVIPELIVDGIGGPRLAESGVELLERSERLSAMGLAEAAGTIPAHWRLLRAVERRVASHRYDAAILVDYPGFHLRLAGALTAQGVPVIYYIAPQLWAWGRARFGTLRHYVRHLAVILPFEESFFREHGIPTTFVSHPLLDDPQPLPRADARRLLGITASERVLAVFPGSRPVEQRRHWEPFRDTARRVCSDLPGLRVVVAGRASELSPTDSRFAFHDDAQTVLAAADVALCKSGTSTLQAALADVPMVIAYRMHPLTFAVARRVVRVPHVGLVNLLAQREVAPECLQGQVRPAVLGRRIADLLEDGAVAARQREEFGGIRRALGTPGAARRVAELTLRYAA
ncbi:MAG: lipid-A-disaccharide synthase [Gemmatimonadota bacterium]|nr:lipid-A-disaccharide synthase [Gemmatimonadota bacterium]MDH3477106.1 lipid-A-disaccharide synthase [Gemmatimonadota bacterium]MDH3570942.1 lipid-A-disaccharide synthase [Gemmatimonadota bacterium]